MTSLRTEYGPSTAIAISLASITSGGAQQSAVVDNTGEMFIDVLVQLTVKLQAGTPGGEKSILVYAYASEDGTKLTDNATGSDGTISLRQPTNLRALFDRRKIMTSMRMCMRDRKAEGTPSITDHTIR